MPIKSATFKGICTKQTSPTLHCGTRAFTWALCVQENSEGKERALSYLSRTLVEVELNYSPIEKMCLALMFVVQKLRHYMQAHIMYVISKVDPTKYIMSKPVLHGRLAKWAVILKQYDLVLVS